MIYVSAISKITKPIDYVLKKTKNIIDDSNPVTVIKFTFLVLIVDS